MTTVRVIIIGGGIAGLATAVRLINYGIKPVVVEKRPFLGGRAFSFYDRESGEEIDNGQHVFLGACDQFQQYINQIGGTDQVLLNERIGFPVIKRGKTSWIKAKNLPTKLVNLVALLGYNHIGLIGKARILWGLLLILLSNTKSQAKHDKLDFDQWLRNRAQNNETIENFWNLIVLPSLNDQITAVSAKIGIELFKVAFLSSAKNPAIGIPLEGLSTLLGENARRYIENNGGEIHTGVAVDSLDFSEGRAVGVTSVNGLIFKGDAVVSAVPAAAMLRLNPTKHIKSNNFFEAAKYVQTAPIVAIHIWYDRHVMNEPYAAILDSPLQWVFNETMLKSKKDTSQHIVISLSGAWEWKNRTKTELRSIFVDAMKESFPLTREASIEKFTVVKMLDATFRVTPGSRLTRLQQRTPIPNFYLAGDWTDTGWPSTMESAVRSGNIAAKFILEDVNSAMCKQ